MTKSCRALVNRSLLPLLCGMLLVALAALHEAQAAPPNFVAAGSQQSGSGAVSPSWPTHQIGDVALLFVESASGQAVSLSTPAGFALIGAYATTGTTTSGTRITVFWARATSTAMSAPTVADPGDHVNAQILTYRGVIGTNLPYEVSSGGAKSSASTSVSVTGVTTTLNDELIVQVCAKDLDSTNPGFSNQTNANLSSLTERVDIGTQAGNGGGFAVWDGGMATPGATGSTTATVVSSVNAFSTIALKPAPPTVTSISMASTNPTAPSTAVAWSVVFSTSVSGVDATDFALVQAGGVTGAAITSVTGSGTNWIVNANTGTGGGTLGLNLVDNDSIVNIYAIALGGAGTGNGNFTGQVYTVTPPFCSPPSNIPAGVSVSCQCDTFARPTLNPSTIFNSNWTVSTSDATGILPQIVNAGYLRLTNNTGNNAKAATVPGIFPAAGNYISVEFRQYAYNGSGADGLAVTLSDYSVPAVPGAYGGSLGYAQETGIHDGFAGGWLGVALDEYGNYQSATEGRLGGACTAPACMPQSVGARGSGSGQTGYRWLGGSGTLSPKIDNNTSTSPSLGYYYQIVVDARNEPTSTAIAINRDTGGGYAPLISMPNVYTAATAQGFTQAPVPANWQISFTGSTGGSTNIHEIGGLRICASTMVPPSGGTAGGFSAVDEAYGTPPNVAVQNYLSGHIYAKLVGTAFKLNVAALTNNQIVTTYAAGGSKTVTVNLVDNSDGLTDTTKDCSLSCTSTCTSKTAVTGGTQTLTFASGSTDKGQKQSSSFTLNTAYQKLVAIISDGTTSACSIDSFSVRPLSIASVTSSNASNAATTGTPILKAGSDNFSLTATTTGVAGSPSGYIGSMKINTAAVQVASPATVIGTLAGATPPFPAATSATPASTATGLMFTYSEVGGFKLPGYNPATDTTTPRSVYDDTWTGVDSVSTKGDCVANSYSNTKDTSGKYGCNFGLLPNAVVFGRFVPDHFNTVVTQVASVPMACPDSSCPTTYNGIVYSGQPFSLTVTAKNASDATTANYSTATGFAKSTALSAFGVLGTATAPTGAGTLGVGSVTAFAAGTLTEAAEKYTFSVTPTAPTNIYIRASDGEASSLRASNPTTTSLEGGVKVASGRIKIPNVYGSESLPLPETATVQYYSGMYWVTSTMDSTTAFDSHLSTAGGNLVATVVNGLGSGVAVTSPGTSPVVAGVRTFTLSAPLVRGSANISLNAPSYLPSSTGRATFGVYKSPLIYRRENY